MNKSYTFLVAGGGTGGHLFPALAVVEEIQSKNSYNKFHFVGREDKIEGKIIPSMGYNFHPIEVEGLRSILSLKNISIVMKIMKSERLISNIIEKFNIQGVIATGAYISYPPCKVAIKKKIPVFLIECNVNPGKTISILAPKSTILFTSFPDTANYFKNNSVKQIVCSGNPVRKIFANNISKEETRMKFGLKSDVKTVLIVGGSLGSQAINQCIEANLQEFASNNIQLIWQTGNKYQYNGNLLDNVVQMNFIDDMASAYAAADIVVSRSGASALSEISIMGKPSILIPFQMGMNDEQLKNAKFFENMNAAIVLLQSNIDEMLLPTIINLLNHPTKLTEMQASLKGFAKPDASQIIAENILNKMDELYS